MAIDFDEINRVTLRLCFLPWFKQTMADMRVTLPADWNPSDEVLNRLAERVADALREVVEER
jgi:hypothetical protein